MTQKRVAFQVPYDKTEFSSTPLLYGSSFPPTVVRTPSHDMKRPSSTTKQPKNQRTTKTNQKLVLFPEGDLAKEDEDLRMSADHLAYAADVFVPENLPEGKMTAAERLNKDQRFDVPRVSSYCIAESFMLESIAKFVREKHSVTSKTFDECLYIFYESHVKDILFGSYFEPQNHLKFSG
jgi:uncharacterized Rmd1/YagE family protein